MTNLLTCIKFLYDPFFKEIFNPELARERLEEFLSLLLNCNVKILEVLPTDSTRLGEESSLLIMDIVVQLSGGAIVNLEIQKVGYKFPGERSACYSSDLLLRQYKRAKSRKNKRFSYKDIKDVYTIVLFESSPERFRNIEEVVEMFSKELAILDRNTVQLMIDEMQLECIEHYQERYVAPCQTSPKEAKNHHDQADLISFVFSKVFHK